MTDTMHAITVDPVDHGLRWDEVPLAPLAPDMVRVRVRATAVNRADLLQRIGRYPVPKGASPIMGLEAAGVVTQIGADVMGVHPGARVCVLLEGGGYAEYVDCHPGMLLPIPTRMSFDEAAALPEVYYTAYLNLYLEGALAAGETVLLHAAASGVGTAALQLCRRSGNEVIATASASKLDTVRALGATLAIDRRASLFVDAVREHTGGRGVDVILDPVGGAYLADNIASLAKGGRLVVIGLLGGASADLPLGTLLMKRLRVVGSVLRSRSREEKLAITASLLRDVWPGIEDGTLLPVIDRRMPITDAHEAHEALRSNETIGKVVLTIP